MMSLERGWMLLKCRFPLDASTASDGEVRKEAAVPSNSKSCESTIMDKE
jgi:hypothetical protein